MSKNEGSQLSRKHNMCQACTLAMDGDMIKQKNQPTSYQRVGVQYGYYARADGNGFSEKHGECDRLKLVMA